MAVTKGVLPILMHHDGFYVSGGTWAKFSSRYPQASFTELWQYNRKYEVRNAESMKLFRRFQSDRLEHHRMLLEPCTRREFGCLRRVDAGIEYVAPLGLFEPKSEPIEDDRDIGPSSFMFMGPVLFG